MEALSESQTGILGSHYLGWLGVVRMRRSEFSVLKPNGKARLQHRCLDQGGNRSQMTECHSGLAVYSIPVRRADLDSMVIELLHLFV